MKKYNIRFFLSLLLSLVLLLTLPAAAYAADSKVTFEDGKLIVMEPGSVYTDSDLFDSFKNVMPGDTRTEEITVRNNTKDWDYIKVYLCAVLHDETGNPISEKVLAELKSDERRETLSELEYMYDFLSQLNVKVWNEGKLIYDESPDKLGGLAENVCLGTLRRGESVKLSVELNVPLELDNTYSNRIGEADWIFVAEGFNDPGDKPQTGDGFNSTFYLSVMSISAAVLAVLLFVQKRRKNYCSK